MLSVAMSCAGLVLGLLLPKRWGAVGFVAAALALFALHFGINTVSGFEGSSIEESLLLFNGSWLAYLGFNVQITYRAFAPVLFALALPLIYRLPQHSA